MEEIFKVENSVLLIEKFTPEKSEREVDKY